jgi:hypothetical protein
MSSDSGRPDCNFCGGGGLPILPVRYAVARSDAPSNDVPEVPEELKDEAVSRISLPDGQHYTLRLLREGFLYLYNAARGRWQGYHVTREGFLARYIDVTHRELLAFDPDAPGVLDAEINAPIEDDEFPCRANPEHVYPGRCVTIPAADEADDIYMTFSDDRWTKRVWKEYATNRNGRRDTMRRLSLPQWKGGDGRYVKPLAELGNYLAEAAFSWTMQQPRRDDEIGETATPEVHALSHSQAPVNGMRNDIDGFVSWTSRQAEPSGMTPALFVLDDAAGVTSDLASLLEVREEEFNQRELLHRPFVTAGVVNALRDGIQERARIEHVDSIVERRLRDEYYNSYGGPPGMEASLKARFEHRQRENAEFRQEVDDFQLDVIDSISDAELDDKGNSAWRKYGDKLRDDEPDKWMQDTYQPALAQYDTETMRPLVEAYLAWLTGGELLAYLDSRFDDRNIESGITFVSVISAALLGTQSYAPAFKQYVAWLSSDDIANDNLLLRALCLNHEALREQVLAAADAAANVRQAERQGEAGDVFSTLSWGTLIASFSGLTAGLPDEMVSPAWLVGRLLGPMMSAVNGEHLPRPLLVALGVTAGQPVRVFRQRATTLKQAIPALSNKLRHLYPQLEQVDQQRFQRKLEIETRSLRQMSNAAAGQQDIVFAVRQIELGTLSDYGAETRLINQSMGALEPMSDIGSRGGVGEKLGTLVANRQVSAGVLSAFLAICAFNSYLSNMDRLLDAPARQKGRLMGAGLAASGAGLELIAATLRQARRAFVTSNHLLGSTQHRALRLGLRLGLAGGLTLGVMDIWEGVEKFGEGDYTMGSLNFVSGTMTVLESFSIFFAGASVAAKAAGSAGLLASLSVVGLWWAAGVFGVIAIGAAVAIWWFTEDDMEEWLADSAFGVRGELGLGTAALVSEIQRLEAITQESN